jgi:UDP-N-acetylglucosamine--dolichyl-phosphate N-acetylglucosaminephosphotransferase
MILPTIASFPLIFAYTGSTTILVPKILTGLWGANIMNLGILFKLYMSMLAVFCTNAINIYAGINGLEVGQSLIIGISIVFYNLIELTHGHVEENLFSLTLMIPFVMTSFALFMYNKYPSQCFIGDTYCYFAGMTFACAGILGHYSKTLLLFFIPQILNFVFSIPQVYNT